MFDDKQLYDLFNHFQSDTTIVNIKLLYNYLIDKSYNINIIINNKALIHIRQGYDTMKYLLDNGCNPNISNKYGLTALHYQKEYKVIKLLVERGGNIHAEDNYSFTISHWQKEPKSMEYLIKQGHKINNYNYIIYPKLYKIYEDPNIMLIEGGYDPYNEYIISITPIFLQRNIETIALMIPYYMDIGIFDIFYESPLFKPYVTSIMIKLFCKYNYNINHQNNLGNTLLHVHHDINIIYTLLTMNIDLTIRNKLNNTAYNHHFKKGNKHICRLIKRYYSSKLIQENWKRYIFKKKYIPLKNYLIKQKFLNEFLYIPPHHIFPGGYEYQKAYLRFEQHKLLI
jgi:hypothetical protein